MQYYNHPIYWDTKWNNQKMLCCSNGLRWYSYREQFVPSVGIYNFYSNRKNMKYRFFPSGRPFHYKFHFYYLITISSMLLSTKLSAKKQTTKFTSAKFYKIVSSTLYRELEDYRANSIDLHIQATSSRSMLFANSAIFVSGT